MTRILHNTRFMVQHCGLKMAAQYFLWIVRRKLNRALVRNKEQ